MQGGLSGGRGRGLTEPLPTAEPVASPSPTGHRWAVLVTAADTWFLEGRASHHGLHRKLWGKSLDIYAFKSSPGDPDPHL